MALDINQNEPNPTLHFSFYNNKLFGLLNYLTTPTWNLQMGRYSSHTVQKIFHMKNKKSIEIWE